jgi:pilus assembly protein CpaE
MQEVKKVPIGPEGTTLTVAVLGPDEQRRKIVAGALAAHDGLRVKEFSSYPPKLEDLPQALAQHYEVIIVDVDSDTDFAYKLIDALCATGRAYVMAYSAQADMKLAVRFMRAGVRDFLTLPLDPAEVTVALRRAATRQPVALPPAQPAESGKPPGKLFVFLGTKGGCGVTTLASNFALSLYQESDSETLLIDFGQPLGDVAINLGLTTEFSVAPALQDPERLDSSMLAALVSKHSSGLSVLAAPNDIPEVLPTNEAVEKILTVARETYEYIVVDAGSRLDLMGSALFSGSATVYLVTQVGITEMRNANRMILKYFVNRDDSLQIVINRYKTSDALFDEAQINKALTRPAQWKIPDDYAAARRTRNTPTPLALQDSAISQQLRQMAKAAGGIVAEKEKKSFFRLFG